MIKREIKTYIWLFLMVVALFGAVSPVSVNAQASSGDIRLEVIPTLDGNFKNGEWLAVWVEVENFGPDIIAELRVTVSGGGGGKTFGADVSLATGARKRVPLYILPNNYSRQLTAYILANGKVLAEENFSVQPFINSTYMVAIASQERGPLGLIDTIELENSNRQIELVDIDIDDLPEKREGLASLDTIILNGVDTHELTTAQREALSGWVQHGGRVVIGGGGNADKVLSGLGDMLTVNGQVDFTQVEELPGMVEFSQDIPIRISGPFLVAERTLAGNKVLASQEGISLVVESRIGFGWVDYVALDLTGAPFNAWAGTPLFWEALLSPGSEYGDYLPVDTSFRQILASNMTYPLMNFMPVNLPSVRNLGIVLFIYVILVGPVNYIVLKRKNKLHLAWLTIPVITGLFSVGTFGMAYLVRGNDIIMNQISIIELKPNGGADVRGFVGLFSPGQQSYDVEVSGNMLLGPMEDFYYDPWSASGSALVEKTFLQGEPSKLTEWAVNQWSMESFMAEGSVQDFGRITADLVMGDQILSGTVTNGTEHLVSDAVLLVGFHFVRIGDLAAGETVEVEEELAGFNVNNIPYDIGSMLFEYDYSDPRINPESQETEMKRATINSVFQFRGGMQEYFLIPPGISADSESGVQFGNAALLGWVDTSPLQVSVVERTPQNFATGLVLTPLSYGLREGDYYLLPGLIPGRVVESSTPGGFCGWMSTTISVENSDVVLEFEVPKAISDGQITNLVVELLPYYNSGELPEISLYSWVNEEWEAQPNSGTTLRLSDYYPYLNGEGLVRVQLSHGQNLYGCYNVSLGIEGTN